MGRSRGFEVLGALALASAVACAGTQRLPLAPQDRAALAGARVVHVAVRTPDPFSVRTPGAAAAGAGGLLGGAGSLALFRQKGESMLRQYQLPDPSRRAAERLGAALRDDLGAREVAAVEPYVAEQEPRSVAARFGAGLVLDLRTEHWELLYYATDWSHYRLLHRGSARLLEAPSGRVLWQDRCETESGGSGEPPTLAALEANGAALLKAMLEAAGDECARQLRESLLAGAR